MPAESSKELCHGVCRMCGHRKHLVLPGRVCHKCIERALDMVAAMDDGELIAAMEEQRAPVDPSQTSTVWSGVDAEDVFTALEEMDLDDDD